MTVKHETVGDRPAAGERGEGVSLEMIGAWLLGILGAVAAFLGVFILVAGDDQSVGLGGDLSWKVGEISAGWSYGLLIGGLVLLLIAAWLYLAGRNAARIGGRATSRELTDLVLHTVAFTLVNAFLWLQDFATGGGLEYAYWITIPWAVGLAIHAGSYYAATRRRAGA